MKNHKYTLLEKWVNSLKPRKRFNFYLSNPKTKQKININPPVSFNDDD